MNKIVLATALFILTAGNIFTMGYKEPAETITSTPQPNQTQPARAQQTRAEQVIKALAEAYPRQIDRVEFRNGDWAVLLRDTWYFYAGGRLLPQNLLASSSNYNAHSFYNYQRELPAWRAPSLEESERLRNMTESRNQNPSQRSPHFFDALWRAANRNEAYDRVKTIRFLGLSVTVHSLILENLSLVEETILAAARADPQVQTWINGLSNLEGWSWRNIADTQSRSFHAYGLAIDIIPRSYGGKQTYWLWASRYKPDWWNISYNERYHPPETVIKAFEKYGFVWGGKWLYFDTMHFEYRPEVLILNGMPPETRR